VAARLRALLFDLDGVLVDSLPAWHAALNVLRRASGLSEVPLADFEPRFGQSVVEDCETFFAGLVSPSELSRRYDETFPYVLSKATPMEPDLGRTLAALKRAGFRSAVTTNSPRKTASALLEAIGGTPFFERVVTADDVAHPKPAPDMLLAACSALGSAPEDALLIGDSPTDVAAARAAGVQVVSYRTNAAPERIDDLATLLSTLA
jgi:HAD superfamily hydrolase (TIGR01509 family)